MPLSKKHMKSGVPLPYASLEKAHEIWGPPLSLAAATYRVEVNEIERLLGNMNESEE
jgi:hypothetical protein